MPIIYIYIHPYYIYIHTLNISIYMPMIYLHAIERYLSHESALVMNAVDPLKGL